MHQPAGAVGILVRWDNIAQPAIREAIITAREVAHRIGPEPRKVLINFIGRINAMKETLDHHFIHGLPFEAKLSAPDAGVGQETKTLLFRSMLPGIPKPRFFRGVIFDLVCFVIEERGDLPITSTKRQASDTTPTPTNVIRTIK